MRTVSTLQSNILGIVLSVIVGAIAGKLASSIFLTLTGLSTDWWFAGFFIPGAFIGVAFHAAGKEHEIPVGHKGTPKFLGQRIQGWELSEGTHWQFPYLMGVEQVDRRTKTTAQVTGEALSKDNVKMTGEFFFTYIVADSDKNLSADRPLESLMKFGASQFRNGIAAHTSEYLEDPEGRSQLAAELLRSVQTYGKNLGYEITNADIPEILPPPDIAKANEKLRIEQAEAASEAVERNQVIAWIDALGEKGVKPELALETMQTERGKAEARRNIIRIEGAQGLADSIGGAIVKAAEHIAKGGNKS